MRLVLHIGMHKTGTSAVQAFCRANRQGLRAQGFAYPTGLFKEHPGQHSELHELAKAAGAQGVAELASDLRIKHANDCDIVFLSGESLCTARTELAASIAKGLKFAFEHVDIVFVVRNKPDYIYSQFNQHMRVAPYTVTFDTFVKRMRYAPRSTFDSWNSTAVKQELNDFKILNYEHHRENFIESFFYQVFGDRITMEHLKELKQMKNTGMDYLTASIFNASLKDLFDNEMMVVSRCYHQAFKGHTRYRFPIESVVKRELNARCPDEGWHLPGYESWYEELIRLEPEDQLETPSAQYLDDLVEFLRLVRNTLN